jgi:hypothetical protein
MTSLLRATSCPTHTRLKYGRSKKALIGLIGRAAEGWPSDCLKSSIVRAPSGMFPISYFAKSLSSAAVHANGIDPEYQCLLPLPQVFQSDSEVFRDVEDSLPNHYWTTKPRVPPSVRESHVRISVFHVTRQKFAAHKNLAVHGCVPFFERRYRCRRDVLGSGSGRCLKIRRLRRSKCFHSGE